MNRILRVAIALCLCGLVAWMLSGPVCHMVSLWRQHQQQRLSELHALLGAKDDARLDALHRLTDQERITRDHAGGISATASELSWAILSPAYLDRANAPVFTATEHALDRQPVTLRGYMFPLDQTAKQEHFLLSPYPPSCPYCLPAAPSELVDIHPTAPLAFSDLPITLHGRFELLSAADAKEGMFYRLTAAQLVK